MLRPAPFGHGPFAVRRARLADAEQLATIEGALSAAHVSSEIVSKFGGTINRAGMSAGIIIHYLMQAAYAVRCL